MNTSKGVFETADTARNVRNSHVVQREHCLLVVWDHGKIIARLVLWRWRANRTCPAGTRRCVVDAFWTRPQSEISSVVSRSAEVLLQGDFADAIASESLDDGEHDYVHEELQELGHSENGAAEPQTEDAANV